MREDQYVVIQAFMLSDLHLKGNELIVYATIYGFTQDGSHWFYGTRGYLAEWCGAKRETVDRCLKSLIDKGYVERREVEEHGRMFVQYRATKNTMGTQKSSTPPKKTSTPTPKNGHINKIEEQPKRQEDKERKRPETFDSIIEQFTEDQRLREALGEFVRYRTASAKRSKKAFTSYAMKQNLGKLRNLASDPKTMTAIVNQTIERGWSGFFELKDGTGGGQRQKPKRNLPKSQMRFIDDVPFDDNGGEYEDIDY